MQQLRHHSKELRQPVLLRSKLAQLHIRSRSCGLSVCRTSRNASCGHRLAQGSMQVLELARSKLAPVLVRSKQVQVLARSKRVQQHSKELRAWPSSVRTIHRHSFFQQHNRRTTVERIHRHTVWRAVG
ncbi:hypothetical protein [Novipirellula caenicola]|uniref:hypothetical protein n=1 Tax=Novipirellula caenicola TaxID=1536901 RepID=UPI0031E882D1